MSIWLKKRLFRAPKITLCLIFRRAKSFRRIAPELPIWKPISIASPCLYCGLINAREFLLSQSPHFNNSNTFDTYVSSAKHTMHRVHTQIIVIWIKSALLLSIPFFPFQIKVPLHACSLYVHHVFFLADFYLRINLEPGWSCDRFCAYTATRQSRFNGYFDTIESSVSVPVPLLVCIHQPENGCLLAYL